MALSGFLFILMRIVELTFLIPIIGMLAYFVNGFRGYGQSTPAFILVLFVVSVLAAIWALLTLVLYALARKAALVLAIVDLLLFAALIAGVVVLGGITNYSCSSFPRLSFIAISLGVFNYNLQNACQMLKASFAFGIMEIIFFLTTFLLALLVWRHHRKEDRDQDRDTTRTEKHVSRRKRYRTRDREGGSRTRSRNASRSVSRDRRREQSRSRRTRSQYSTTRTYT